MKTYRIENWDLLRCPHADHAHVGGQIYGHPKYADGTFVMGDKVIYFDNELRQVMTHASGLLQLGEPSEKMKQKIIDGDKEARADDIKDAAGNYASLLEDMFSTYVPEEWGENGKHQGVEDAADALNALLKQVFGREGAPDKKRKH